PGRLVNGVALGQRTLRGRVGGFVGGRFGGAGRLGLAPRRESALGRAVGLNLVVFDLRPEFWVACHLAVGLRRGGGRALVAALRADEAVDLFGGLADLLVQLRVFDLFLADRSRLLRLVGGLVGGVLGLVEKAHRSNSLFGQHCAGHVIPAASDPYTRRRIPL